MEKGVLKSLVCILCGKENQTVEHMLLVREWTKGVWFKCCWGLKIEKEKITTIDEWLLQLYVGLKKADREGLIIEVAFICWQIWKIKSEMVVERKVVNIDDKVTPRIRKVISKYYQYRIKDNTAVDNKDVARVKQKWNAHEIGWIKINNDGAFDINNKEAGSGVIARNSEILLEALIESLQQFVLCRQI